jgi:hypothetical protein
MPAPTLPYHKIKDAIRRREEFDHDPRNMSGSWARHHRYYDNGWSEDPVSYEYYIVLSYATPIAVWDPWDRTWYINERSYSVTTSKQQSLVMQAVWHDERNGAHVVMHDGSNDLHKLPWRYHKEALDAAR